MLPQPIDYGTPSARLNILAIILARRTRRALAVIGVVALLYASSYIGLSVRGRYEPLVIGISSVKVYAWAPAGFVKNYRHRWTVYYAYAPLYLADRNYWHQDDAAYRRRYPVHIPKNVNEVATAWKQR